MEFVMLVLIAAAIGAQQIVMKFATTKYIKSNAQYFMYNGILCLIAGIIAFIWKDKPLVMPQPTTIVLALLYGTSFIAASMFFVKAATSGPLSLTTLFANFSMIVVIVYSIMFLNEELGVLKILGIILIFVSFALINDFKSKGAKKEVSAKWLILVVFLVLINGSSQVFQKMHQSMLPGVDINEFLVIAYFCASIIAFIYLAFIKVKSKEKVFNKVGALIGVISGGLSLVGIKLIMILASKMDGSIMFPIINVLILVFVTFMSRMLFKERFTGKKILVIFIGIISVVLLSI